MVCDGVESEEFALTQEFMGYDDRPPPANVSGYSYPRRSRLIQHRRGVIHITGGHGDRKSVV